MSHDPATIETEGTYIHETTHAVLFNIDCERVWIPKTQLVCFPEFSNTKGELVDITCSKWFADLNL